MKISTKGRYALQMMLDLACHDKDKPISVQDIAKRQGISKKYLEQIISILVRGGYVKSIRGAKGGYFLRNKPKEYTVGMILRLIEGDLAPVDCVGERKLACNRQMHCVTYRVWNRLNDAINSVIDDITLEEMVDWSEEIAHSNDTYEI